MNRTMLTVALLLGTGVATLADNANPAPASQPGQMTMDELKVKLEGMGLEVTGDWKTAEGKIAGYIVARSSSSHSRFAVSLSPNGKYVWVTASVCTYTKPLPEGKLLEILGLSGNTGLVMFQYHAQSKTVYAKTYVTVPGFSPAMLQRAFDELLDSVNQNLAIFDETKWSTPAAK